MSNTLQEAAGELAAKVEDILPDLPLYTAQNFGRLIAEVRSFMPKKDIHGYCGVCGKPMPEGEEMFRYHGYSGPCPK